LYLFIPALTDFVAMIIAPAPELAPQNPLAPVIFKDPQFIGHRSRNFRNNFPSRGV
jgi:hypothetical protein